MQFSMAAQETAIIVAIISAVGLILSKFIDKISFSPSTPDYEKDGQNDGTVSLLRHKYGCSRFSILGYHNGGHWIDNTSISKFTCRHESVGVGTQALQLQMQGVSTSFLKEMPAIIKDKGILFEADIVAIRTKTNFNPSYYEVMRQFNTVSTLAVAIKKPIWKWKRFKYEVELVASIHMNWTADSNWPTSFMVSAATRLEVCNELCRLIKHFDSKAILDPKLFEKFGELCEEQYKIIQPSLK